jgi:hypothetical protein
MHGARASERLRVQASHVYHDMTSHRGFPRPHAEACAQDAPYGTDPKLIVRKIAKRPRTRLAYQLKLMFTSGPNTGLLATAVD